jgi:tRNA (uracil-5-)-methyltransferase TRM9
MAETPVTSVTAGFTPEQHELDHVHSVYDRIADHFSSTRYKVWSVVFKELLKIF